MPFPLVSHQGLAAPALVVGRRQRLDAVAYLIGTLAPDLSYAFDRSRWDFDAISHTVLGMVVWCVPLTIGATWVFRRLVARPLATQLPDLGPLRLRDLGWAASDRPAWWVTVLSAALGTVTHVVFDGITHPEDWAVHLVPGLDRPAPISLSNHPPRATYWYDVLRAGADVAGVVLLGVCLGLGAWRRRRDDRPRPDLEPPSWPARYVLVGTVAAGGLVGLAAAAEVWGPETKAQATMLFTWSVALAILGGCLLIGRHPAEPMDGTNASGSVSQ